MFVGGQNNKCSNLQNSSVVLKNITQNINVEVNQPLNQMNTVCVKEENPQQANNAISQAQIVEQNNKIRQSEKEEKQKKFEQAIKQRARMIQKENQIKKMQEDMQKNEWKQNMLNRNKISFTSNSQITNKGKKIGKGDSVSVSINKSKISKTSQQSQNKSNLSQQQLSYQQQQKEKQKTQITDKQSTSEIEFKQQEPPKPIQQDDGKQVYFSGKKQKIEDLSEIIEENQENIINEQKLQQVKFESPQKKVEIVLPQENQNEDDVEEEDDEDWERDDIFDCQNTSETINKYSAIRAHLKNYTIPDSYSETYSEYFGHAPVFY
ncbi:hypothetical protein PPERSA_07168 [Pseudocohnilembus persalinus]|uniref:Uncharacterized protein n=1 Tax=Pseudocohnilembus persalinus TaxID=266149 RepID=A0A0V0QY28_PSEPJ|nr:hypothetical protein PPERSA_07168 [Pseudocohnilembus persalinus]|eukprot:KRX07005.1 hypothetical protein PPERSA_07168 [Pseudocohnilembus persalinus]